MNLDISCCQLCNVEAGATTKNGPHVLWVWKKTKAQFVYKLHWDVHMSKE